MPTKQAFISYCSNRKNAQIKVRVHWETLSQSACIRRHHKANSELFKIRSSIFLPIKWDPIQAVSSFSTMAVRRAGSLSSTPAHCPLLIWLHFQHKSDDWSRVMWVVVGREGVWRGDGGSCFDLSEICAHTKTTEISIRALHARRPPLLHTRPSLALARQLNPSLCVPHSCMDLSAMGQRRWGVDRVMITKQVFPVKREGQLTEARHRIRQIRQMIFY